MLSGSHRLGCKNADLLPQIVFASINSLPNNQKAVFLRKITLLAK